MSGELILGMAIAFGIVTLLVDAVFGGIDCEGVPVPWILSTLALGTMLLGAPYPGLVFAFITSAGGIASRSFLNARGYSRWKRDVRPRLAKFNRPHMEQLKHDTRRELNRIEAEQQLARDRAARRAKTLLEGDPRRKNR